MKPSERRRVINNIGPTTLFTENISQLTPLRLHLFLHGALAIVWLVMKISLHVRQQLML